MAKHRSWLDCKVRVETNAKVSQMNVTWKKDDVEQKNVCGTFSRFVDHGRAIPPMFFVFGQRQRNTFNKIMFLCWSHLSESLLPLSKGQDWRSFISTGNERVEHHLERVEVLHESTSNSIADINVALIDESKDGSDVLHLSKIRYTTRNVNKVTKL